jgi:4-hydroxy 2-oxovalerate aldolase
MKKNQIFLDCTFRDGGYYVNWDFEESLIIKYLKATKKAKINIIEMGFRFLPKNKFLGALGYTSDNYLKSLPIPNSVKIAVMINADEILSYLNGPEEAINLLFNPKNKSPVDIVRIATNAKDILACKKIAQLLKRLGYQVYLNLMQIDHLKLEDLSKIAKIISNWKLIKTLYFADTFGSLEPDTIEKIVYSIKLEWKGDLGFHAHDNKGYALANCIVALKNGVNYLDGTLLGMGRGAGNVKTENLLIELSKHSYGEYIPEHLFQLILQDFQKLKNKYGWGPNVYYHLSAMNGIHPTYIQQMLGDERYEQEDVLSSINFLKLKNVRSYNSEILFQASKGPQGNDDGEWSAENYFKKKNILIIGAGQSIKKYLSEIKKFINTKSAIVVSLNINPYVPNSYIDYYVACHDYRLFADFASYAKLKKPLIIPKIRLDIKIKSDLQNLKILDYGLKIKNNTFKIKDRGCVLSQPYALLYGLAVITAGNAKNIYLAGFEGYSPNDNRQQEINSLIDKYLKLKKNISICAITPTILPIMQRSIFDPLL